MTCEPIKLKGTDLPQLYLAEQNVQGYTFTRAGYTQALAIKSLCEYLKANHIIL